MALLWSVAKGFVVACICPSAADGTLELRLELPRALAFPLVFFLLRSLFSASVDGTAFVCLLAVANGVTGSGAGVASGTATVSVATFGGDDDVQLLSNTKLDPRNEK